MQTTDTAPIGDTRRVRNATDIPRYILGVALLLVAPAFLFTEEVLRATFMFSLGAVSPVGPVLGYVLFIGGWLVLPGTWTRRSLAAGIGLASLLLFANTLLANSAGLVGGIFGGWYWWGFAWLFKPLAITGVVAAWLVVRKRPAHSFFVLPLTFLIYALLCAVAPDGPARFALSPFEGMLGPVFGRWIIPDLLSPVSASAIVVAALVIAASAWVGRLLDSAAVNAAFEARAAKRAATIAQRTQDRELAGRQADLAWRADEIKRWEEAHAATHDGQQLPPGFVPSVGAAPSNRTNTMAILALVFGILGGWLGILFGHLARGQIRRTAERGWALATVGLVLGYVSTALLVVQIGFAVAGAMQASR